MPRSLVKKILELLAKAGIEIEGDAEKTATAKLDALELSAGELNDLVGDNQTIVSRDDWQSVNKDLKEWKQKARDFEKERNELQEAMDTGDSVNARKAANYKDRLDEIEPLVTLFLEEKRADWKDVAEKIPEEKRKFFTYPEKDAELDDSQVIANVKKFKEFREAGAISDEDLKGEDPAPARTTPKVSPTGEGPKHAKPDENVPVAKAMESGYGYQPPAPRQGS